MVFSLHADIAFYSGERDDEDVAFSDNYSKDSIIEITYNSLTVRVKVVGALPKTLTKRDLALSRKTLTELGIYGSGDTNVNVKLLKGSRIEETALDNDGSGWYSIILEMEENTSATEKYNSLIFNGFKPRARISEEGTVFTIPYVEEYELEEKKAKIEKIGLTIHSILASPNPYEEK